MSKTEINHAMRQYVRDHLTPTAAEREYISRIYKSVQRCLGESNCLQIGSYARFTAIRPPHDLDVLFVMGDWTGAEPHPGAALRKVCADLERGFANPTPYRIAISVQTHSVSIAFLSGNAEVFAVDIVPAYIAGRNGYGDDTYVVPEIVRAGHAVRQQMYAEAAKGTRSISWIRSDPRGYTTVAASLNQRNEDFRRAAKFVKGWRAACRRLHPEFALKSFHAEQVITRFFQLDDTLEVSDAVGEFFRSLPSIMERPQIRDRADGTVFIDQYLASLSRSARDAVVQAGRDFAGRLGGAASSADIVEILRKLAQKSAQPAAAAAAYPTVATQPKRAPTIISNPSRPWGS